MALMYNSKKADNLYYNSKKVCSIYYGGVQIFRCSTPPTVDDNTINLTDISYTFKAADFTKNFLDPDGDSYKYVEIKGVPKIDGLEHLGSSVQTGLRFLAVNSSGLTFKLSDQYAVYGGVTYKFSKNISEIVSDYEALGYKLTSNTNGVLGFEKPKDLTNGVTVSGVQVPNTGYAFIFTTTDDSGSELESNIATLNLVPVGDINVKEVYVNTPPTVGDNTITVNRSDVKILSRDVFLKFYNDMEGDAAYELRIDSLPTNGTLYLRGVPVTVGQILSFKDDIDAKAFTFDPDTNTAVTNVAFSFSVSDVGSKTFG